MVNASLWQDLTKELATKKVTLVAVSKKKPASDIKGFYDLGQRDFGENYVQELVEKHIQLPADIRWHYIGHLQSNKVKEIAPFVTLIHAVDSFNLLVEINKHALKNNRVIDVLLQMHIAEEDTKFGMDETKISALLENYKAQKTMLDHIRICGLMGMATFTDNEIQLHAEYKRLHDFYRHLRETCFSENPEFSICSIGMSGDYEIAIQEGSNMMRIGSLLFGRR